MEDDLDFTRPARSEIYDRSVARACFESLGKVVPVAQGEAFFTEGNMGERMYLLLEAQFRNYYFRAVKMKGVTGANLLRLLEQRLDNMVFRMGFTPSRETARQLVLHKHFEVNGKAVDRPSYQLRPGDRVSLRERSRNLLVVEESLKKYGSRGTVPYVSVDVNKREGVYLEEPTREMIPVPIEENIIVELYSK